VRRRDKLPSVQGSVQQLLWLPRRPSSNLHKPVNMPVPVNTGHAGPSNLDKRTWPGAACDDLWQLG